MKKGMFYIFLLVPIFAFSTDIPEEMMIGEWLTYEFIRVDDNGYIDWYSDPILRETYTFQEDGILTVTDMGTPVSKGFWNVEYNTIKLITKEGTITFYCQIFNEATIIYKKGSEFGSTFIYFMIRK